ILRRVVLPGPEGPERQELAANLRFDQIGIDPIFERELPALERGDARELALQFRDAGLDRLLREIGQLRVVLVKPLRRSLRRTAGITSVEILVDELRKVGGRRHSESER